MMEGYPPIEVFCSYSHKDEVWLRKLVVHLRLLERERLLLIWHDRLLQGGMDWAQEIDDCLNRSRLVLLLISPDFVASDYCYGIEMQRALERHEANEARVIPILVRPVGNWQIGPFSHLQALPPGKFLVEWSEREEDIPFALIANGIYETLKDLPTQAVSAPHTNQPAIWNIPYPRNPFFVGREELLSRLHQQLEVGQAIALSQPQAISGLGGIGKTQVALEYAYRYRSDYQVVLWAQADTCEALTSSYLSIAALLNLSEKDRSESDRVIAAVKDWLRIHRGWLLVLDNADELAQARPFLPTSFEGHVLLTTRARAMGRIARCLEVEILPVELGTLFLLRRAGLVPSDANVEQASDDDRDQARGIYEDLGGLPLALDQAGAYLEETGTSLAEYRLLYQQHRTDMLRERRGLVADHPASVSTTWLLSFKQVKEKNPAAADLLRMLAHLAPDTIPEEILTAGAMLLGPVLAPVAADAFLLNQAIEVLRAYSLVQRDPKGNTLSIHRLVQAVLQDTLERAERHRWAERAMLAVNAAFPHAELGTWSQCERLLLQAVATTQVIERYQMTGKEARRLLYEATSYLRNRARYAEQEPLSQRALWVWEQQLGPEHPDLVDPLTGLANLYRKWGKYTEVEPLFQRALRISEQQLGSEHPDLVEPLTGLARLYRDQGKYTEAEPLYQRALRISERQLGSEHPDLVEPLTGLANLYRKQGKYTEAEPLFQRALRISEQQLGSEHPDLVEPLTGLANLYREQGKYTEAEPLYQRALRISERHLGSEHPDVAYPLYNLARLYREQGKRAEVEPLFQQALQVWEQHLGPEHPYVAYPLTSLANLYREQGKYTEAEPLFQRAQHIRELALGPQHPETAETMHGFAQLREAQGNSKEARVLYAHALAVREQTLGVHHRKTMEIRQHLIALLHVIGQHGEAAQLEAAQSKP